MDENQPVFWNCPTPYAITHRVGEQINYAIPHIHDQVELLYNIRGGDTFYINDTIYTMEPHDLFIVPPMQMHKVNYATDGSYERYVINLYPQLFDVLEQIPRLKLDVRKQFEEAGGPFPYKVNLSPKQQEEFMGYCDRYISTQGRNWSILRLSVLLELIAFISVVFSEAGQVEAVKLKPSSWPDQVLYYIEQNFCRPLTVSDSADALFINEKHLCRLFKQATGTTVNRYIIQRRVVEAKKLLYEGKSVKEVYQASGFNDYSNFIRTFKKLVGVPPGKFHKEGIWR